MTRLAMIAVLISLPTTFALAAPDASILPIKDLKGFKPKNTVFKAATRQKPLVIKSEKEAAEHFGMDALAALKKQVDFEQQIVLVFAWRGSGQDRLSYDVAESFPEQVFFRYKPGRTKDLRPHTYVFALRSNVKWRAAK
jgi:hypothetical protein